MIIDEILSEFVAESKSLIDDMAEILDDIEGEPSKMGRLADFSLFVDRIMGGAKNIAMSYDQGHVIHRIGDYTELCKIIGARAAKLSSNIQLYDICVAFLMDATEMLEQMMNCFDEEFDLDIREVLSETFLSRLKWINQQYDQYEHVTDVDTKAPNKEQSEIDNLLAKLGVG